MKILKFNETYKSTIKIIVENYETEAKYSSTITKDTNNREIKFLLNNKFQFTRYIESKYQISGNITSDLQVTKITLEIFYFDDPRKEKEIFNDILSEFVKYVDDPYTFMDSLKYNL